MVTPADSSAAPATGGGSPQPATALTPVPPAVPPNAKLHAIGEELAAATNGVEVAAQAALIQLYRAEQADRFGFDFRQAVADSRDQLAKRIDGLAADAADKAKQITTLGGKMDDLTKRAGALEVGQAAIGTKQESIGKDLARLEAAAAANADKFGKQMGELRREAMALVEVDRGLSEAMAGLRAGVGAVEARLEVLHREDALIAAELAKIVSRLDRLAERMAALDERRDGTERDTQAVHTRPKKGS